MRNMKVVALASVVSVASFAASITTTAVASTDAKSAPVATLRLAKMTEAQLNTLSDATITGSLNATQGVKYDYCRQIRDPNGGHRFSRGRCALYSMGLSDLPGY